MVAPKKDFMSQTFDLAGYTFILQILLRVITFVTNAFAYRFVDASIIGLANFRIGLYYSTLVFTARESFRHACLSRGGEILLSPSISDIRAKWRSIQSVMWLTVPVGILMAFILLPVWLFVLSLPTSDSLNYNLTHQYKISCLIYTVSAFLELSTEPMWLVCQLGMFFHARIMLEAFANIVRAVGIIVALWFGDGSTHGLYLLACPQVVNSLFIANFGLYIRIILTRFTLLQLLHGSTLVLGYVIFSFWLLGSSTVNKDHPFTRIAPQNLKDFLPTIDGSYDWPCLILSWNFFRQGILKQFLTEGERYLISAFHLLSFSDQGIYDLVNNLGSIAPRLVFSSVEESCHLLFSQCIQRDVPPKSQSKKYLREVIKMLSVSLRLLTLIAWVGCVFAQGYSHLLLYLYGGSNLITNNPGAVNLLRIYALYLVLLAWNGPTEAFLNAAMTTSDVSRHNFRLMVFSFAFLGAAWLLVPLCGTAGFILANCVNITTRVLYSCYFIGSFVDQVQENHDLSVAWKNDLKIFSLRRLMLPSKLQTLLMLITLILTLTSEYVFCSVFTSTRIVIHIAIGGLGLLVVAVVILWQEKPTFMALSGTGFGRIFAKLYNFLPF